jgi:hypothetical protein
MCPDPSARSTLDTKAKINEQYLARLAQKSRYAEGEWAAFSENCTCVKATGIAQLMPGFLNGHLEPS